MLCCYTILGCGRARYGESGLSVITTSKRRCPGVEKGSGKRYLELGGRLDGMPCRSEAAQVGTRACDAIEILPLVSALPSNRWLPNRGPCQAGVHACLPSSSLSPRLIDSRSLTIHSDHDQLRLQLICGSTAVLYSTYLPTVPGTGCTPGLIALLDLHIHMHTQTNFLSFHRNTGCCSTLSL